MIFHSSNTVSLLWRVLLVAVLGLSFLPPNRDSFRIEGCLGGMEEGDSLYLIVFESDGKGNRLSPDSLGIKTKNGCFSISGETNGVKLASLVAPGSRSNITIYLEPGTIQVMGHIDSSDNAKVNGTYNNDLHTRLGEEEAILYAQIKALYKTDGVPDAENNRKKAEALREAIDRKRIDMIRRFPDAMVSGTYLYVLQDKLDLDTLKSLYGNLGVSVKNTWYARSVAQKIPAREKTRIGNSAPHFITTNLEGKEISPASFKGKYLLLDFWASWCVPCRAENPHLIKAYQKYKDRGFEIVSVTLDDSRSKWEEAIQKDGLDWMHVNEVKGFAHPIARLYGVQPIPDNFLIGPDGRIIARRLRGDEVEKILQKYIQ